MASSRSAGKAIEFAGKTYTVEETTPESFDKDIDLAIFSAGAGTSKKFAPEAAKRGVIVVDNSSCWRMDPDVPLVVPEVNPEDLKWHHNIIANPNCSTIQAMLPLKAVYDKYGIERIVYSTYQAVSGAGVQGYRDLKDGVEGVPPKKFPYPIAFNILPHIDDFLENGYTKEEMKMVNETHKILHDDNIRITSEDKPSSVNEIEARQQVAAVKGGISIEGFEGQQVRIYTVDGKCVFNELVQGTHFIPMPAGIYVADGQKIIVK